MDVTQKTVTANTMASGITALKNDGTDITGTLINGDNIEYGITNGTLPQAGVGKVGQAQI